MNDVQSQARLIDALRPWSAQIVWIGGVAHQLHRLHEHAAPPAREPLRTRDGDLALDDRARLTGSIGDALGQAGFKPEYVGSNTPPIVQYRMPDSEDGFYAEFIVPLRGSGLKRDGSPDLVAATGGISAQKLRHADVLLIAPWGIELPANGVVPLKEPARIMVVNAVSFMAQKLLIHESRRPIKQAQDALYLHDTIDLFGGHLEDLRGLWLEAVQPALGKKLAAEVRARSEAQYGVVTDLHREAARIAVGRGLSADALQAACKVGLAEVFTTSAGS